MFYFCERKLLDGTPWIENMIHQMDDASGAAVTFSMLVHFSDQLMRRYVNIDVIRRFRQMICDFGPQQRFLNFFASICSDCSNAHAPLKINQDIVLRLTWIDEFTTSKTEASNVGHIQLHHSRLV